MKVTVNFGNVRVIVPCGNGELFVRDLMQLALTRYKKATAKPQDTWVTIHNLKLSSDGGILDPDDQLNDVADDREQIIAIYEEQDTSYQHHNGGDGTSASSVGTESPDIFQIEVNHNHLPPKLNHIHVEINGISPLQVRRGSEPALNNLSPVSSDPDPTKRWSAAVILGEDHLIPSKKRSSQSEDEERGEGSGEEKSTSSHFSRSSGRLSILGNNSEMLNWAEAADRQLFKMHDGRREPLGGSGSSPEREASPICERDIVLKKETGPLGIHVVPNYDSLGNGAGIVVQTIDVGSRIERDGRMNVGDCIVAINGKSLVGVPFHHAQDIFRQALDANEIRLKLVKGMATLKPPTTPKKPPPPIYPKPTNVVTSESELVEGEERGGLVTKLATVTPTKQLPPNSRQVTNTLTSNTRKIGKKIGIQLTKGPEGLGFSITTRDNPAGGNCPIYIKNILPKGAAVHDGRLKPGDRLLEVNGMEMTGKSQTEAVQMLRNTPPGGTVELVVSRQESKSSIVLPRELHAEQTDSIGLFPWKHREVLTFDIPVSDTVSAGLGISVMGLTSTGHNGAPVDLGIFVKSVLTSGAAYNDGRVKSNDQLVNVNGTSLLSMSNAQATEVLSRTTSQNKGPIPGAITLTVARRIPSPSGPNDSPGHDRSDSLLSNSSSNGSNNLLGMARSALENSASENSETTVIFLPKTDDVRIPLRNPMLERIMGQQPEGLRNESYLRASHESWGPEQLQQSLYGGIKDQTVMTIEEGYEGETPPRRQQPDRTPQKDASVNTPNGDFTFISQLSIEEEGNFCRDGFGRQSMSEKRHAQLDARNTDTYQRNKKSKDPTKDKQQPRSPEERNCHHSPTCPYHTVDSPVGPSLGMRKSSSLESLQTMVQELQREEASRRSEAHKGRGCNESFRAAVDRSYEAPAAGAETMETLEEESESGSSSHGGRAAVPMYNEDILPAYIKDVKAAKKKGGLLKGLGSVFKFGKTRKDTPPKASKEQLEQEAEKQAARKAAQEEQERIQEQYKKLLEQQQQQQVSRQERMHQLRAQHQKRHQERQGQYPLEDREEWYEREIKEWNHPMAAQQQVVHRRRPLPPPPTPPHNEAFYYGRVLPKASFAPTELRRTHSVHCTPQRQDADANHGRTNSFDLYKEMDRPGSRRGIADATKFSHYMNYKEIQAHLRQFQQQPQNKRRERPISNYFEYESVPQMQQQQHPAQIHHRMGTDTSSLPRRSHGHSQHQPLYSPAESNGYHSHHHRAATVAYSVRPKREASASKV